MYTVKRNSENLFLTSRNVALEVNAKNLLCVRVSSTYWRPNDDIQWTNKSFENVANFEYLDRTQIKMACKKNLSADLNLVPAIIRSTILFSRLQTMNTDTKFYVLLTVHLGI
jgi:hypothetical protein